LKVTQLKVLIAGNLANLGYELAKALRDNGTDAKLLLPKFPAQTEDPKFIYPELEEYPKWLVRYDNSKRNLSLDNWKLQIIREMRKKCYDIIIAMTEFPIFAMFSSKPFVVISTGSDMRELLPEKSLTGMLLRLSYKKAKKITFAEPDKWPIIEKFRFSEKSIFLEIPRNSKIFSQKIDKGNLQDKLVIFHPTAQDWKCKGNEKFIQAYIRLCATRDDIHLLISNRGPDIEKVKKNLIDSSAKDKFELLPLLGTEKLQYYYNLSDVIVDQFTVGSFGMITREAMQCAKPVLVKINEYLFTKFYKNMPNGIINVSTEDQIFYQIDRLASNRELCVQLGQQNRKWVEETFNNNVLTQKFVDLCESLL